MRPVFIIGVLVALILPMAAAARPPVTFSVLVKSPVFDGSTVTLNKNQRLAEVELSMPYAVQLDGTVPADIAQKIANDSKSPLVPGKVLLSSGDSLTTFCGPGRGFIMKAQPCLIDIDGDGRFETAARSVNADFQPNGLTFKDRKTMGIQILPSYSLAEPVPYHRIDASLLPRAKGELIWYLHHDPKPSGPLKVGFQLRSEYDPNSMGLYADGVEVTYDGAPVSVDLGGIHIAIQGLGPNGELICQVSGALDNTPFRFSFADNNTRIIYM